MICLPNVHTEAAPEAPGGLEGRNSIKESWQQVLSPMRLIDPLNFVLFFFSLLFISLSLLLPPSRYYPPLLSPLLSYVLLFSSPLSSYLFDLQSLARCLSKEEWVAAQSIKVIGNTAIPVVKLKTQILTPPSFSSQAGSSYYENESRHDHGSDRKRNYVRTSASHGISSRSHDASASVGPGALSSGVCSSGSGSGIDADSGGGSVLSLDISFEGPGHYGLEANKMTTSLIKVTPTLSCLKFLPFRYFLPFTSTCRIGSSLLHNDFISRVFSFLLCSFLLCYIMSYPIMT